MIESQLKVPYVDLGVGVGSARWPIRYVYYEIESVYRKKREKMDGEWSDIDPL